MLLKATRRRRRILQSRILFHFTGKSEDISVRQEPSGQNRTAAERNYVAISNPPQVDIRKSKKGEKS